MSTNQSKRSSGLLALVGLLGIVGLHAQTPAAPATPKLLVILVVDQMRFEYVDRFAGLYTAGLKRLARDGAVFERANYPYVNTVTCAGHATISTGAFPSTHGIILNEWWQRAQKKRMPCTDDPSVTSIPYGARPEGIGHSAKRLRVPTLGDRLRAASPASRTVTLSVKPRSAVMLAGHGGTAATWFGSTNEWATSSAYAAKPLPAIQAFIAASPLDHDRTAIWNRVYDVARYTGIDQGIGEHAPTGWTTVFPHPLAGEPGTRASRFYDLWERSPYADAYVASMAAHMVRKFELGQRDVVDYLGVSFSALDSVGHDFGPNSHEIQDTLVRLDRSIGELFTVLDAIVGPDRYVVGLSSDHGVADIPEALTGAGLDGGRILGAEVRKVAEAAMTAAYGPGPHIAFVEYSNLYLTDAARARVTADSQALKPLLDAIAKMSGVLRVFTSDGLDTKRGSTDPIERAAALSHYPGESGDVVIIHKPNWIGSSSTTTHGSMQAYDQHVPVILMGAPIKPGRYSQPTSPADLAPTLASLVGLTLPDADGRVLREAIK